VDGKKAGVSLDPRDPGLTNPLFSAGRSRAPPRIMTRAWEASIFFSPAVARSARYSCQKLKMPLMMFTAQVAMPGWG